MMPIYRSEPYKYCDCGMTFLPTKLQPDKCANCVALEKMGKAQPQPGMFDSYWPLFWFSVVIISIMLSIWKWWIQINIWKKIDLDRLTIDQILLYLDDQKIRIEFLKEVSDGKTSLNFREWLNELNQLR